MSLRNAGTEPDRLVGASSPRARSVEIHEMTMTEGVMRMRPLGAGIAIQSGDTAWLRPGGTHLMLIGPAGSFARGEVAAAGAREAAGHGGH